MDLRLDFDKMAKHTSGKYSIIIDYFNSIDRISQFGNFNFGMILTYFRLLGFDILFCFSFTVYSVLILGGQDKI